MVEMETKTFCLTKLSMWLFDYLLDHPTRDRSSLAWSFFLKAGLLVVIDSVNCFNIILQNVHVVYYTV